LTTKEKRSARRRTTKVRSQVLTVATASTTP
jgi:hypothetical protein